jgi:antirestriction protein
MPATLTDTTPRAWVGCLSCYGAGRLTGEWVDGREAATIPTTLATTATYHGTTSTYDRCRVCGGDEWWVMDHEGYGPLLRGECSPAEAQQLAELLDEVDERDAFAAWLDDHGPEIDEDPADLAAAFADAYRGQWDSLESYAAELVDDLGMLRGVPEAVARYFDLAAFARDLELGGDYWTAPDGVGGVYVFDAYA